MVLKNVSCEYDLFEWLKLNFASYVVHQTRSYNMVFVNQTYDMIINTSKYSVLHNIVRACSMFYHEGYRSVTPLDAAKVNRTIFHKITILRTDTI